MVTARLEGYLDHSTPYSFPKHPDWETKGQLQANNRPKPLRDGKIKDNPEVIEEIQSFPTYLSTGQILQEKQKVTNELERTANFQADS